MEKGTIGILAVGLIAVWAFFSLTGTHDVERAETRARIERDTTTFDAEFAKAQPPGPDREKDIAAADVAVLKAQAKLDAIQNEAEARRVAEQDKRDEIQGSVEKELKVRGGPDLKSTGDDLAKRMAK